MRPTTLNARHPSLRVLYAGAALLILLLLAANTAVTLQLRESAQSDEERDLKNISLTLAEQADRSFQAVDLVISSVVARIAEEGGNDPASFDQKVAGHDFHLLLREKITGVPQLDAVVVINRDGKVINFSRSWPIPDIDNSERDYFRAMKADGNLQSYISAPVRNHGSGTWSIFLVRRVSGAEHQFLGLVLGTIELQYFEDFYRAITLSKDSTIAIQRSDGVMLARYPPSDAIGKTFSSSQRLLGNRTWGVLREPSPIDGAMRIKAAHLVNNYPVIALATEAEDATLAGWRRTAWLMALGALGCAFSIAVAAFAIGRQWKQLAALAEAQAEIQRQEDLAAAFDAMRVAKEDAERADLAKSEFIANMSHELRTPLNAVLGFSEILIGEGFGPLGNERYRGYARDIHASGTHLLHIINDILDLSKASAGKLELIEGWFDARDVINSGCQLVQPRLEAGKLSLVVDLPPGGIPLYADERKFKQILLNLLSNACKFTAPGGHVECSITIDTTSVSLSVADTGIGIPTEDLTRVLQPFVQLESSLSRQHDGTGLGLALVKIMAELHGGSLRLDSTVGRGTTVRVAFPLNRVQPPGPDIAPGSAEPRQTPAQAAV